MNYFDAVYALVGGRMGGPSHGPMSEFVFDDGQTRPTEKQIQAKLTELQAAEPIRLLRVDRDKLLAESDWTGLADSALTSEVSAKWKLYRQRLRDLPSGLNTPAKVKSAKWPAKPV